MIDGITGIGATSKQMDHEEKHHTKHKMMTLYDITDKLYENFPDEINDANHYMDMAKSAHNMGHEELAHYLSEMAKDEYTHAMFIHHHLKESGIEMPEEWHKEWEELENRFRGYFE